MDRTRRDRITSFVLLPCVLVAVGVVAYFTFRTTLQVDKLRQESVFEATLGLAYAKANNLDSRIVEEDNVVSAVADPASLSDLAERWLPTAQRETPTVRAILVLDAWGSGAYPAAWGSGGYPPGEGPTVLAFASRAGGALRDEEAFRRLLVTRMVPDMKLNAEGGGELRHLHHEYDGQSYLVSYWQKTSGDHRYVIVAWHDVPRIIKDTLPTLNRDTTSQNAAPGRPSRVNVVDEEGRTVYGPPLRSRDFTAGVPFPTTLYNWRVQVSPAASEELSARVQRRRLLELAMVTLSGVVIIAGVVTILFAAEKERRMSALRSEFVANVSHELKTPLALVRMFGEMLQSGKVANEAKRQEYLDIIVRESERLSSLIENVLDFAKVDRGRGAYDFNVGDVGAVVGRAAAVYRYRAEREGVELAVEVQDGLPKARMDERAIQLAVINLLDNALKYAPHTGTVTIRTRKEGGAIAIRVIDNGPGVPPDERERIFERFVRGASASQRDGGSSPPVRGSGIGLALVKHIAESHGGRAWVESSSGQGSTFVVTIPSQE
jgi:two-component system, OmpR family, phosphate regulon sensor histidine kinase PhoR